MKFKFLISTVIAGAMGLSQQVSAKDVHEITFSSYLPPSYEYVWTPMNNFMSKVEERSEGRVKFNVFHSAQLFDGYEELPALSRGDVDMVNMTSTYPSGTVPALSLFSMPFMFDDIDHITRVLKGGLFDLGLSQEMEQEHDAVVLGFASWDPGQLYSRRTPILKLDDFKRKVWASTGSIDAETLKELGGSPTTLPSSELYLAFDRGIIDATPRPMLTGLGRNLYEVMEHLTMATFGIEVAVLAINKQKWEGLPKDIQQIITEAAVERDAEQYELVKQFIVDATAKYESLGVKVHQVEPDDLLQMRKKASGVVNTWAKEVKHSDAYLELVEEMREN
ncbi:TRAP transporter substrate-binding protein [Paenalcaligenes hominis]|uniref:TRAP transporter substrate-binding protein n=1 Tax=Paenalcaligenes hominis TaxID=643674 RepID=UPI003523904A